MTAIFPRLPRRIAPLLLALGLTLSPALTPTLRAQAPEEAPAASGEEKGRPLDGYLGTLCLVMFVFWVVGRSARR
jgi:hypothetical protein